MDDFPTQRGERAVRFGCGGIFGFIATFLLVLRETSVKSVQLDHLLFGIGGAVVAGLLAAWLGDSFWSRVAVWWSRW
jgi:hypothetical protein